MAEFPRASTAEYAFAEHEHQDLVPGINRIHELACQVGDIAPADVAPVLREVTRWVATVLRPHAAWEDAWLYPEIARRAGTPWATRLMAFEHGQILAVAATLVGHPVAFGRVSVRQEMAELRGHLFALEALLRAHMEREQRFLIPLLETPAGKAVVTDEIVEDREPAVAL